jgi:hypothetical protein
LGIAPSIFMVAAEHLGYFGELAALTGKAPSLRSSNSFLKH